MAPKIYIETTGQGPDLFLIHGWALHGGVWEKLVPELTRDWRVTCVDLPGHGRSRETAMPETLSQLARMLTHAAPKNAVWLGWSLGGMVALRAALDFPMRLRALVLVNSTPRFMTAPDWLCAMPLDLLQEFTAELTRDYRGTVQRFLGLQVCGGEHARDTLRQLRNTLSTHGEPDAQSLATGLEILRNSDLRAELTRVAMPTLVISGDHDRLTPPAAGETLAANIRNARLARFPKSAHAPFLPHPEEFAVTLRDFLNSMQERDEETRVSGQGSGHG